MNAFPNDLEKGAARLSYQGRTGRSSKGLVVVLLKTFGACYIELGSHLLGCQRLSLWFQAVILRQKVMVLHRFDTTYCIGVCIGVCSCVCSCVCFTTDWLDSLRPSFCWVPFVGCLRGSHCVCCHSVLAWTSDWTSFRCASSMFRPYAFVYLLCSCILFLSYSCPIFDFKYPRTWPRIK